jgi:hypothetical protein
MGFKVRGNKTILLPTLLLKELEHLFNNFSIISDAEVERTLDQ